MGDGRLEMGAGIALVCFVQSWMLKECDGWIWRRRAMCWCIAGSYFVRCDLFSGLSDAVW